MWAAMITNAARPAWPDDIFINDWAAQGLIIPSKVRTAKVFTLEISGAVLLGHASPTLLQAVRKIIGQNLGWR